MSINIEFFLIMNNIYVVCSHFAFAYIFLYFRIPFVIFFNILPCIRRLHILRKFLRNEEGMHNTGHILKYRKIEYQIICMHYTLEYMVFKY